jgi:hypothetical protein
MMSSVPDFPLGIGSAQPDGSTYLPALAAFSANGYATADLPPGQYKIALA